MMKLLNSRFFDPKVPENKITAKEKILGYFMGPIAVMVMNAILSNYLNVYYTDVLKISTLWGGSFIALFPIVAKVLDVITFIYMGLVVDKTKSRQGKARPWILFAAPLMVVSMILLFVVPRGNENLTAIWIFVSYTIFYAVAYTMYSTAHTLMVPLATKDPDQRRSLSTVANTPGMAAGSFVAILFPTVIVPLLGVIENRWVIAALLIAVFSFPLMLFEFFFTRERVVAAEEIRKISLREQLRCCLKSRPWVVLMLYMVVLNLVNALFSTATFYYCNWVLGSYNDGHTQALFYALGQAPLGIGVVLCGPIVKKLGKRNALLAGMIVATAGAALCLLNPRNLPLVLAGQFIRTVGLIPGTYLISSLLGDALDDVERVSGQRCDGFSSSVFNCIITLSGGLALAVFNFGIAQLGYQAPTPEMTPVQNDAIQTFLIFCVMGVQLIAYPLIGVLTRFFPKEKSASSR